MFRKWYITCCIGKIPVINTSIYKKALGGWWLLAAKYNKLI